jgi:NTP pyrophosphatase (non-canonical NTP hydrolase)
VRLLIIIGIVVVVYVIVVLVFAFSLRLLNMETPKPPPGRAAPLPLPPDPEDPYYEGFDPMPEEQCPEDPRQYEGQPIGMYHCGSCGCMVVAGLPHGPHDDGCWLGLDGGTLALRDLQREVGAWQRRTLDGDPPPLRKALKVAEEAGEVAGAVNKLADGRRTVRDVEDESGDAIIALCGLADAIGFDLATAVKRRWRGDVQWRTPRATSVVEASEPAQDAERDDEAGVPPAGLDVIEG